MRARDLRNYVALKFPTEDEPVFVLRARDPLAPQAIEAWCQAADAAGVTSAKVSQARQLAERMQEWPVHRLPD